MKMISRLISVVMYVSVILLAVFAAVESVVIFVRGLGS